MVLQFREPFPIQPNNRTNLDRINDILSNVSGIASQRRQQKLEDFQLQQMMEKAQREKSAYEEEWVNPMRSPMEPQPTGGTTYGTMGPQPQGTIDPSSGIQGPQPRGALIDQFNTWRSTQVPSPMDQYSGDISAISRIPGSKRRAEALNLFKTASEAEKNRSYAEWLRNRGQGAASGDVPVEWKTNPYTGLPEAYPKKMPAGQVPMRVPTPQNPPAQGAPDGLDYKTRVKLIAEKPKARASLDNTLREYDNMIREAEAIKNDPALTYATGLLTPLGKVPGTPSKDVTARLETLKAKTLLNVLASLKDLSATGASGFGQLSNIEGENIRNSVASLDMSQGTKALQSNIDRFVNEMRQKKDVLRGTFKDTYGEDIGSAPGQGGGYSGGGGGAGKIRVTNGTETLLIDEMDRADAIRDGYEVLE